MKALHAAICLVLTGVATPLLAQTFHLKCAIGAPAADNSHYSWIAIDQAANFMRVNGDALPLSVTNEKYSSRSRDTGAFATLRSIDRTSGEITVATIYEGRIASTVKGSCEKADPPSAKF